MWKIHIPSRVHIFLCLLANNKVLARDNLAKRKSVDDKTCLFCSGAKSVCHLFFECCAARLFWQTMSEVVGFNLGADFESVARLLICEKKHRIANVCTSAALWVLWKLRNELCFQVVCWTRCQVLMRKMSRMLRDWRLVNRKEDAEKVEELAAELKRRSFLPPRLCWEDPRHNRVTAMVSVDVSQVASVVCESVVDGDHVMCMSDDLEPRCFEPR
jgi:hypothetical protein